MAATAIINITIIIEIHKQILFVCEKKFKRFFSSFFAIKEPAKWTTVGTNESAIKAKINIIEIRLASIP